MRVRGSNKEAIEYSNKKQSQDELSVVDIQ